MREIIVLCVFACVAVISVQSATVYRNGREAAIEQLVEQIIKDEIVSELRKGEIPVAVETEPIIAPVEALRNVEPVVEIQEQQPIVSEKVLSVPLAAVKTVLIEEPVEVVPEEPKKVDAVKALLVEEPLEIVEKVEPAVVPALKTVLIEESVPVVVVVGPVVEESVDPIESVRDNSAGKADEIAEETAPPARPTIIETIQTFAQNIPIFRTSTAKAETADADAPVKPPPNILEQFTSNIQNVFRPPTSNAVEDAAAPAAAPASPIEAVQTFFQSGLTNIQNAFTNTQNAVQNALNPNRAVTEKKKETEKVSEEIKPVAEKTDVAAGKTVEKEEVVEPVLKAVVEQIKSE